MMSRLTCQPRPVRSNATVSHRAERSSLFAVQCQAAGEPHRAVIVLPGLANCTADYSKLSTQLQHRGLHVEVAPVKRIDWARNAAGLIDPNYWTGKLKPRPTVDWYLERIDTAVAAARASAPDVPITLLAHSAGGWLGRLYLLDFGTAGIDQFVSLGSPHLPPPEGVVDQTRGILTHVADACPGAFHSEVQYITIAGRYIQGAPLMGPGSWSRRVVGAGYQQVCGDVEAWGDGVVPVPAAHLEGALQLTLDGVYHSPLGAVDGAPAAPEAASSGEGSDSEGGAVDSIPYDSDDYSASPLAVVAVAEQAVPGPRVWYGSAGVLEQWVGVLLHPAAAPVLVAATAGREAAS